MKDLQEAEDIAEELAFAVHMESAACAPQTSPLIEAAKRAVDFLMRYAQAMRNSSAC